jgi:hypothetical protein
VKGGLEEAELAAAWNVVFLYFGLLQSILCVAVPADPSARTPSTLIGYSSAFLDVILPCLGFYLKLQIAKMLTNILYQL